MLTQNLKTATELKIPEEDHIALIKILGMLERGELQHSPPFDPIGSCFNMAALGMRDECGTVGCFAGWVAFLNGRKIPSGVMFEESIPTRGLRNLYLPPDRYDYTDITVEQGAHALRNYLTTGNARWREVLK